MQQQLDQLQVAVAQVTKQMDSLLQNVGCFRAPAMYVSHPKIADGNSSVNDVDCKLKEAGKAYAVADVYGRLVRVCFDGGLSRSVISAQFMPGMSLAPNNRELIMANGLPFHLDGEATVHFTIDGCNLSADVSMLPDTEEFLLGADWLAANNCLWNFATGAVHLGDRPLTAKQKVTRALN